MKSLKIITRGLQTFVCIAILSACGGGGDEAPKTHLVEYAVSGVLAGNSASITYRTPSGGTEQKDIALPGSINYFVVAPGTFLYISAQNKTAAGFVSVAIKVDGVTWKSATSSSAYGIASTSGTCCEK